MDLLLIFRKLWRYKLATAPVIALTIAGAVYVVAVRSPVYEATGSYILINPPAPPTDEQIARKPALGQIKTDNPYTRFSDSSVIIDVLSRTMTTKAAMKEMARAGASPNYSVASAAHFGLTSPIVQITALAPSPEAAIRTASVVGRAVVGELNRMQAAEDVDEGYRIKAMTVDVPDTAQLRASGQLRSLVGVLGFGAVLLFVVVSVFDALAKLHVERRARTAISDEGWGQDVWYPRDRPSQLDAEDYALLEGDASVNDPSIDLGSGPGPATKAETNGHAHRDMQSRGEENRSGR